MFRVGDWVRLKDYSGGYPPGRYQITDTNYTSVWFTRYAIALRHEDQDEAGWVAAPDNLIPDHLWINKPKGGEHV